MTDAAIVLPGESGTVSEATCSLALGRPVVFVGDWKEKYNLDADGGSARWDMLDVTLRKFQSAQGSKAIDAYLAKEVLGAGLGRLPPYVYFKLGQKPSEVMRWIESCLSDRISQQFHRAAVPEHTAAADEYKTWLLEHL